MAGRAACFASVLLAFATLASASPAEAKRVALVIGNSAYPVGPLANPGNDAKAVGDAFQALGFDKVIVKKDLGAEGMKAALLEISREATGSDLAVVYYAGHGTEHNGRNYLIPTDAKLERASDLQLQAVSLDTVLEQLEGATRLRLVILDACRNNVFPMAGAKRAAARGLARIEPENNTLVVYAAKEGTTAEDGEGISHSPFTAALLKHLSTPGLDVTFVFRRVRDDVMAATNPSQQPHVYGTLGGQEIYFANPPATPPAYQPVNEAAQAWSLIQNSEDIVLLDTFRKQYGAANPLYQHLATNRIDALGEAKVKAEEAARAEEAAKTEAERQRVALLLKAEEERRLQEEAERNAPPEPPRKSGDTFRDCAECPEMVVVPAGEFTMGSPESEKGRRDNEAQHHVTIAKPFGVGKYEVTFAEWDACVAAGGCEHTPWPDWGRGRQPVRWVSWNDAKEYVAWLSKKTGKKHRLLTEAEWEYAARAGTTTRFSFGNTISHRQAQYSEGELGSAGKSLEVGSFKPNAFGLHDMHGNVDEWVEDCYKDGFKGPAKKDGTAWASGDCSSRAIRGGSWRDAYIEFQLRVAARGDDYTSRRVNYTGFRVARTF